MRFQLGEPVAQKTNVAPGVMEGEEVCRSGAQGLAPIPFVLTEVAQNR
jgi:hypothetical protein